MKKIFTKAACFGVVLMACAVGIHNEATLASDKALQEKIEGGGRTDLYHS
ncbi:MAG: hypothetical protein NC225_00515 [Clostridium sp.]|nr:hypothetical protein [Clostridium sp.]